MNISVLVYGPDFACSENITQAFALMGNVHLISIAASDWRHYDEGLLANTPERISIAKEIMAETDMIVLGDAVSVITLSVVSPETNWLRWAAGKQVMAYFGDSSYYKHPTLYDGILSAIGARLFLLPNLMPLAGIEAIPLHHPMPVCNTSKAERLTVMHAPGRDGKAVVKGTETIGMVIGRLKEEFDFDYQRLTSMTIADCLKLKSTAHIVIDQMPPDGYISGLGRTGTEALGCGSLVMSKMYDANNLGSYFEMPPVVDVQNEQQLYCELRGYLESPEMIKQMGAESLRWARQNIEFNKWIQYVGKYL